MSLSVIILLGPPGVGKGTQASLLTKSLGAYHLSTGNLIRAQIASGTELGKKVQFVVESGAYVSDDLVIACVKDFLSRHKHLEGYLIIDGIPRNEPQIQLLAEALKGFDLHVDFVFSLEADPSDLFARFEKRFVCGACGEPHSFEPEEDRSLRSCSKCKVQGQFIKRKDDRREVVEKRFSIYMTEMSPVAEYYKQHCKNFYEIDGLLQQEIIQKQIMDNLKSSEKLS